MTRPDHDTRHPVDQLRLVQDLYRDGLGSLTVFPAVADPQREVEVRIREVREVVIEQSRVEVRVVAILAEGLAGVEPSSPLFAAELTALVARSGGVGETLRTLCVVGHVETDGLRLEKVVLGLEPTRAEEKIRGLGAEASSTATISSSSSHRHLAQRLSRS